jgi:hypothetical protein
MWIEEIVQSIEDKNPSQKDFHKIFIDSLEQQQTHRDPDNGGENETKSGFKVSDPPVSR